MHLWWGAGKALVGLLTCNWWFLISNHWSLNINVEILIKVTGRIIQKSLNPLELWALVWKHTVWYFSMLFKTTTNQCFCQTQNTSVSFRRHEIFIIVLIQKLVRITFGIGGSEVRLRSGVALHFHRFQPLQSTCWYAMHQRKEVDQNIPSQTLRSLFPLLEGFGGPFFTSDIFLLSNLVEVKQEEYFPPPC